MNRSADAAAAGGSGRTAWASDDPPWMRPPAFAVTSAAPPEPCDMTKACMLPERSQALAVMGPLAPPPHERGVHRLRRRHERTRTTQSGPPPPPRRTRAGTQVTQHEDPTPRRRRERSSRRHAKKAAAASRQRWRLRQTPPAGAAASA
jgi:hypothetical protein